MSKRRRLPSAIPRDAAAIAREAAAGESDKPAPAGQEPDDAEQSAASATPSSVADESGIRPETPGRSEIEAQEEARASDVTSSHEARSALPERGKELIEAPVTAVEVFPPHRGPATTAARSDAWRIVNRFAGYSAVGGLIPLALVDVAATTAITMQMVKTLSRHYGVPFEPARMRALVTGMIAGGTAPGLATLSAGGILHFVPGANLVAIAVSSVTAAVCVRGIGEAFIDFFERVSHARNSG